MFFITIYPHIILAMKPVLSSCTELGLRDRERGHDRDEPPPFRNFGE